VLSFKTISITAVGLLAFSVAAINYR